MLKASATQVISRPPDQIWELLSDTSRYADWVAGTAEVTRTDGPRSSPRARGRS